MTEMNLPWRTLLRIVAPAAIFKWAVSEKNSVVEIQQAEKVNQDILFRWLKQWSLSRTIPIKKDGAREKLVECLHCTRKELADYLNGVCIRHKNSEKDFAQKIKNEAKALQEQLKHFCIESRQTSLMSKFAFSLHPEIAVPYDQYALGGLCRVSESTKRSHLVHEYPAYLCKFNQFAAECGDELDKSGLTESLRPLWEPVMSEKLFKRRTSDKLLMFVGLLQANKTNEAQRMEALQAWINPSLLVGKYMCQWKSRHDLDNHLKGIWEVLTVLCNETPERMEKRLACIATRFNSRAISTGDCDLVTIV